MRRSSTLTLGESLDHAYRGRVGRRPGCCTTWPSPRRVDIDPATVGALAREVDNARFIENTTVDLARSAQLVRNHGDVISTFAGWDALLLPGLVVGATGAVAGSANAVPSELVVRSRCRARR
ncbi:hypothetical protein GCM10027174_09930 [Salinifilum aidingensis]